MTGSNAADRMRECKTKLDIVLGTQHSFPFISDSRNVMCNDRAKLVQKIVVKFLYGCGTHSLYNFSMDIEKLDGVADNIKNFLYILRTVRFVRLLRKFFDMLCSEKFTKTNAIVMFSKTEWSAVYFM